MGLLMNRGAHRIAMPRGIGGNLSFSASQLFMGSSMLYPNTGPMRNALMGEAAVSSVAGIPSGVRHPYAWVMPNKPGALAARNQIIGSGGAAGTMQSGYNISAAISGDGGVINTDIGLIISIAAAIIAGGGISSAATSAITNMVATITGSGDIDATAAGLADLGAILTGAGVVVAGNTALMDIEANIRGYGDLTPEGLRDAVWNAILTNYPDTGTAGNTLSLAGSGGVDYDTLATAVWTRTQRTLSADGNADVAAAIAAYAIEAGWTTEMLLRVFAAVLAGKVSGAGTGTETFRGINDDKDRVVATTDSSGNRTAITLDGA